jgi:dihydrofolate reductase
MIISLIWAMADNRVIGIENRLPWKLPADMKWFRKQTMGKPIVMGRKTFESFGAKPLPGRTNIIVTHDHSYQMEGTVVVHSIDEALQAAEQENAEEVMIIGGASFYEQMLPMTDRLYVTLVNGSFEGDAFFPEIDFSKWQEVERLEFEPDEKNEYGCSFLIYNALERTRRKA